VHRVSAETRDKDLVRYRVLEPRYEPGFLPGEPVKVACAPVLASYQEMGLTLEDQTPTMVYRLGPALLDDAAERITRIIDRMDAAGARIGVLPEGCLSPVLLDEWRRIARETAAPDKPLRWLLLGSGPVSDTDPPHNRAVLVDRWTGAILLTHDKLERFSVTEEQVRDWHLPWPQRDGPVEEGITRGGTIEVLETRLGRLAVLICEDLNESAGWEREVAAFGVSHLFVPIFAKPILPFRWEYQTAERQVRRLGAWVVISNSLAVAAALGAAGDGYTCLVMGPAETKRRTRYAVATQFGRAEDAEDLGWVARTGGPDLPEILPAVMYPEWFGG
jgi:predicted amidohydrolase